MQTTHPVRRQPRPWRSLHIVMAVLIFWEPVAEGTGLTPRVNAVRAISSCWSDCSVTCGEGTHSRHTRRCDGDLQTCDINNIPSHLEVEVCNEGPCPDDVTTSVLNTNSPETSLASTAPAQTTTTPAQLPCSGDLSMKLLAGGFIASPSYIIHEDGTVEAISFTDGVFALAKSGNDLFYTAWTDTIHHVDWTTKVDTQIESLPHTAKAICIDSLNGVVFYATYSEGIFATPFTGGDIKLIVGSTDTYGIAVKKSDSILFWTDEVNKTLSKLDYTSLSSPVDKEVIWSLGDPNGDDPTGLFYDETLDDLFWIMKGSAEVYQMDVSTRVANVIARWTSTFQDSDIHTLLILDNKIIYTDSREKGVWCLPIGTEDVGLRTKVNLSPIGQVVVTVTFV